MKEINESDQVVPVLKNETEVVTPAPVEYKYLGSKKLIPGLKLWAFDTKTSILYEVPMKKEIAYDPIAKTMKMKRSVEWQPHCIYHQAHCRRTAVKKFKKLFEKANLAYIILDDR